MAQYCKYYKEKKQVSYDNGVTFVDVTPAEYRRGDLIEEYSVDCGYVSPSQKPLTLVPLENGYFTVTNPFSASTTVYYSKDNGGTWNTLILSSGASNSVQASSGETVMWRGNVFNTLNFGSSCNYNVEGNVLSLKYGNNFSGQTSPESKVMGDHLLGLFKDSTKLISAEGLVLPHTFNTVVVLPGGGTVVEAGACAGMFSGCTSLTIAPELPATTLQRSCYKNMFEGCTSLTEAPALSATTLNEYCYGAMFANCTALETAPSLPATSLEYWCYSGMFDGCTSLTSAPVLPASTLADYCYGAMFKNCTSLTTVPVLSATTLADSCYQHMFSGCTSLSIVPSNYLPVTSLESGCYARMFMGCTSLTTAPELPATTLTDECYLLMFNGCSNLNYVKCLATDISATESTTAWLSGVASTGVFAKASSMSSWPTGTSGIPTGWDVADVQNT